jgi:hypothetical protein
MFQAACRRWIAALDVVVRSLKNLAALVPAVFEKDSDSEEDNEDTDDSDYSSSGVDDEVVEDISDPEKGMDESSCDLGSAVAQEEGIVGDGASAEAGLVREERGIRMEVEEGVETSSTVEVRSAQAVLGLREVKIALRRVEEIAPVVQVGENGFSLAESCSTELKFQRKVDRLVAGLEVSRSIDFKFFVSTLRRALKL